MSTKSTILLTTDSEHWYHDCNGRYYHKTKTMDCIVLEFGKQHRIETDEDGTEIIIESDTALYKILANAGYLGGPGGSVGVGG